MSEKVDLTGLVKSISNETYKTQKGKDYRRVMIDDGTMEFSINVLGPFPADKVGQKHKFKGVFIQTTRQGYTNRWYNYLPPSSQHKKPWDGNGNKSVGVEGGESTRQTAIKVAGRVGGTLQEILSNAQIFDDWLNNRGMAKPASAQQNESEDISPPPDDMDIPF